MNDPLPNVAEVHPFTARDFEQIRRLAYQEFGLDLRDGKQPLVAARLGRILRDLKLRSFREYCDHVREDRTGEALVALINALTTNHTSFFREPAHFEFFRRTILPGFSGRDRVTIWSAACSTGEEPYSIAFSLLDEVGEARLANFHILATDISTRALAGAQEAVYAAERLEGIPVQQLRRYVLRGEQRWSNWYRVKPALRAVVEFRRLNLMQSFAHLGPFPVIFCRNVMIYFDRPTQQGLVNRLAACLEPGGYLLIGHAETLNGIEHPLRYVRPAIYRKAARGDGNTQQRTVSR